MSRPAYLIGHLTAEFCATVLAITIMVISGLTTGTCFLLFAYSPSFYLSLAIMPVIGYSVMRQMASANTTIQTRIPDEYRDNRPQALESVLEPYRKEGLFSAFPFGTDFTAEEIVLGQALKRLKDRTSTTFGKAFSFAASISRPNIPERVRPYLQRLELDSPTTFSERLMRNLVAAGLTPYEALRTATANAAEFLGSNSGVVAVGEQADLILVNGDPLKDVSNASRRTGVMLRGQWLTEGELRQMLEKQMLEKLRQ